MADFLLLSDVSEIVDRLGERARGVAGQTVLLSGGCGFLGRYFVAVFEQLNRRVLKEPCTVVVLDNFITAGKEGEAFEGSEHIRLARHDATKPFAYDGPIDYIIQAAGIASPYYYRAYPLETLEVATVGTKNLLELALNVLDFVGLDQLVRVRSGLHTLSNHVGVGRQEHENRVGR